MEKRRCLSTHVHVSIKSVPQYLLRGRSWVRLISSSAGRGLEQGPADEKPGIASVARTGLFPVNNLWNLDESQTWELTPDSSTYPSLCDSYSWALTISYILFTAFIIQI